MVETECGERKRLHIALKGTSIAARMAEMDLLHFEDNSTTGLKLTRSTRLLALRISIF